MAPPDINLDAFRGWEGDALGELALDALADGGLAPADLRDELRVRMRVFAANLRALASYRLGRYDGRVTLIRAADERRAADLAPWAKCVADLELHTVPGNHFTMLRPPNLSVLAETSARFSNDHRSDRRPDQERVAAGARRVA